MISDIIRDIRRKNYLNQTQFALRIGVTQGTVSQWEHGIIKPSFDQLRAIASAFNISIDELLASEEQKEPEPEQPPKTVEARSLAKGIDKMPKAQREAVLSLMMSLYPGIFEGGNTDDT